MPTSALSVGFARHSQRQRNRVLTYDRYPRAADGIDRLTHAPYHLEAFHIPKPHRAGVAECNDDATREPFALAGATLVHGTLWRPHLGSLRIDD